MVRLYHGTNGDNAASILSGNLRPSNGGRLGAGFYFAVSKADAEAIAKHRKQVLPLPPCLPLSLPPSLSPSLPLSSLPPFLSSSLSPSC